VRKKVDRKVAEREDLLFNLVGLYRKEGAGEEKKARQEPMRKTTTPLENATNLNVYYWYFQNPNEERIREPSAPQPKTERYKRPNLVSLFTESVESFNNVGHSMSRQFKDASLFETPMPPRTPSNHPASSKSARRPSASANKPAPAPAVVIPPLPEKPPSPLDPEAAELMGLINERDCQLIDDQNAQRFLLNSAAIRHMPLKKEFHMDAKNMIFVPKSKSFYPRAVDFHLKTFL
jgi:hypothetical protein